MKIKVSLVVPWEGASLAYKRKTFVVDRKLLKDIFDWDVKIV